jgi:hypothetical protein
MTVTEVAASVDGCNQSGRNYVSDKACEMFVVIADESNMAMCSCVWSCVGC